jgi:hypothetical protein
MSIFLGGSLQPPRNIYFLGCFLAPPRKYHIPWQFQFGCQEIFRPPRNFRFVVVKVRPPRIELASGRSHIWWNVRTSVLQPWANVHPAATAMHILYICSSGIRPSRDSASYTAAEADKSQRSLQTKRSMQYTGNYLFTRAACSNKLLGVQWCCRALTFLVCTLALDR